MNIEAVFDCGCKTLGELPDVMRVKHQYNSRVQRHQAIIVYCLRQGPFAMSYPQIARAFKNQSHATAMKRMELYKSIKDEQEIKDKTKACWKAMFDLPIKVIK